MAPSVPHRFPSISHPLSRLGSREALSISGKSRDGRISVDWSFGSASPHPPARAHSVAGSNTSPGRGETPRSSTSHDSRKISTEEILIVLEEKLRSGNFHSIKKMFRSNDPSGEGKVTKEAFSRILWNLCGYLSPRSISHVLRRMGLDRSNSITFEDIFSYFRRPSTHGGASEQDIESYFHKIPNSAPERFRSVSRPSVMMSKTPHLSLEEEADQSWRAFKAMMQTGKLDFEDLFPPMCFGDGAYVIPGQLRECLQKLGIPSSDTIVARILRKLDGASPYAIHTSKLFQHLGLNSKGKLASKNSPDQAEDKEATNPEKSVTVIATPLSSRQSTSRRPKTSHCPETPRAQTRHPSPSPHRPKTSMDVPAKMFDGEVMNFIAKNMDGGQAHFIQVLESKSDKATGMINKSDLRIVLRNLGLAVTATTMEHFLSKNGLRREDGGVNYKLLLRRLQARSRRGTLSKVMKNQDHLFHDNSPPPTPSEGMTASQLEAKLLDIFHKEFLSLLRVFSEMDPSNTGLLTEDEFKTALETRFGISISASSWEQFATSGQLRFAQPPQQNEDNRGYVHYGDFLAKFDVMLRPATADAEDPWAVKEGEESRLLEHKDRYLRSMAVDPSDHTHRHDPRPLDQLEAAMLDVFLYKFRNFKKEYDLIVREDLCRVDKEKLDFIFFRCGFVLTPSELSRLWLSLPITRPMESVSMPTILQQVMRIYYSTSMPGKFSKASRDSAIVSHVLEKIRVPIVTHWSLLKKKLRYLDPMGTSRIEKTEMLQILQRLPVDITDIELYYLIEMLESRIPGKTNYFRLMEYYVKNSKKRKSQDGHWGNQPKLFTDSPRAYPKSYGGRDLPKQHDYRHPTPVKPEYITLRNAPPTPPFKRINVHPGVTKPFKKKLNNGIPKYSQKAPVTNQEPFPQYRGALEDLLHHPPSTQESYRTKESLALGVKPKIGARELPFLGRALRKEDTRECGRISVEAFLKILSKFGVSLRDSNDVYKLLSRYDRKLRDEISYEKFLQALS